MVLTALTIALSFEKESKFFNKQRFFDFIKVLKYEEAEKYLLSFVKQDQDEHVLQIVYLLRRTRAVELSSQYVLNMFWKIRQH